MRQLYLSFFLFSLVITSCKTASKAYEQGNYNDAIELSIKKLQKNPNDAAAKSLLQKSYAYAVNQHEDQIRILNNSTNDNRWEQIYSHYYQLQNLYQTLNRYPSSAATVHATDYSSYVQSYGDKAASVHYNKGIAFMQEDDKSAYRQAFQEFNVALRFKPDEDIKQKMEEAYDRGLVKVLVAPVASYDRFYNSNSSYEMRNFSDHIIHDLNAQNGNRYVQFFPAWDGRNEGVLPDEVLEMRFGTVTIGRPVDENKTRKVSKEVVVKEMVYSKDSVTKQYSTVYATITATKRTLVSDAELLINTRDPQGNTIWSDVVRGQHRWQVEFASYTGDERALSSSDKTLLDCPPSEAPKEDEIAGELLKQLQTNITTRLRNYYSRY